MAVLILPRRNRRVPPWNAEVDWAHPLARGLSLAYRPQMRLREGAKGRTPTTQGIVHRASTRGLAHQSSGNTGDGIDFGTSRPITSATYFTVAVLAAPDTTAASKVGFSQRRGSVGFEHIGLLFALDHNLASNSQHVCLYARDDLGGIGYADNAAGGTKGPDGAMHLWTGTNVNAALELYRDREVIADQHANAGGRIVSSNQKARLGNLGDYTTDGLYASAMPQALTLVWDGRGLLADEVACLADWPWQLFSDPSPMYFLGAADVVFSAAWNSAANTVINSGAAAA